jgi:hypothetical protein
MIGLTAERHDAAGQGPDILWLLPGKVGWIIEAKSRKKSKNALSKKEHGQLLVSAQWFAANYPDHKCIRVCVHPTTFATKMAEADKSYALTFENLARMVSDARGLLKRLCESQLSAEPLVLECARLLSGSRVAAAQLTSEYLMRFQVDHTDIRVD